MAEFLVLLVFIGLFCGALGLAGLVGSFFTKLLKGDPYVDH